MHFSSPVYFDRHMKYLGVQNTWKYFDIQVANLSILTEEFCLRMEQDTQEILNFILQNPANLEYSLCFILSLNRITFSALCKS